MGWDGMRTQLDCEYLITVLWKRRFGGILGGPIFSSGEGLLPSTGQCWVGGGMRKRAAGTTQVLYIFPCAQIDKLRALRDWEKAVQYLLSLVRQF